MNNISKFNEMINSIEESRLNNIGRVTDLKLHWINTENINAFTMFCNDNFDAFNEYLEDNALNMEYIGRTSSFVLNHKYCNLFTEYYAYQYEYATNKEKLVMLIENELNINGYDKEDFTIDKNGNIQAYDSRYIDEDDIKEITIELGKTMEIVDTINKAYECIDTFKEHQEEYFDDFINNII